MIPDDLKVGVEDYVLCNPSLEILPGSVLLELSLVIDYHCSLPQPGDTLADSIAELC